METKFAHREFSPIKLSHYIARYNDAVNMLKRHTEHTELLNKTKDRAEKAILKIVTSKRFYQTMTNGPCISCCLNLSVDNIEDKKEEKENV